MDYDGNDISCHNLQLAGEGKTKSSSVLQPYDFPKFDFGEGLQGHLKFDSLVETEVFLGIQSQENSQWIEDFSRDSNGMEFDSTPADSCSISRRENVWSEATSSESVEMLLKSVGQEETMPEKSIIQEPNACDDWGSLAKNVESVTKKGEKSDGHAANSEPVQEDEFRKDDPVSKRRVEEELAEFGVPSPTLVSGEGGTSNERKHPFRDDNLREPKACAEKSMNPGPGEDSVHVPDGVNYNAGALSTLEALEQVNADVSQGHCNDDGREKHVSTTLGLEDSKSPQGKTGEASEAIHAVCSSFCSVKELGGLNNQDTVGVRLDCVRETIDGDSQMKPSERDERNVSCSNATETGKLEFEEYPARPMVGPFEGFLDALAIKGLDKHSAELESLDAGQFASPEQKRDHCLLLTLRDNGDKLEDLPLSSVESDSIAKMPIFNSDDKKIPVESSSYINETNAGEPSDMPVFSSAAGNKQTENVEGCHNDSVAPIREAGELLVIASKNDSKQVTEENLANRQVDFSKLEQDICKIKERDEKQATSKNAGSLTTDEMTESLDLSKRVIVNNDRKLQHQTAGKMELENDVAPYATSRTAARLKNGPENGQGEAAVVGLSHPDNDCTEAAARVESGANVSTELDSVPQVKDSMTFDAPGIPSAKMAAEPPQHLDRSNDSDVNKSSSMEEMNSICSNHPGIDVGCCNSSFKESVGTALVSGGNQDVVTMNVEGEKEPAQAAELDKTSCGSPTIISSSEPSLTDKDQEEAEGSATTDRIVEGSQSENIKPKDVLGDDTSFTFKVNVSPHTAEGGPGTGRSWSPVPNAEKCKSSIVVEEVSPSVKGKAARTPSKKNPRQIAQLSDGEPVYGTPKGTSERKGRRASAKGVAKENAKKGKKETDANQESGAVKGGKSSPTRLSMSISGPRVQFGKTQPYGLIEQSNTKLSSVVAAPHLSTNNVSPSASFRPPFTDLQQVQLRAQIFVYGSLIQGTAPDEACMASAFGPSDGGRSIWEPVWQAAVERVRIQKSNAAAPETPLHSQSGARASDSAVKESCLSNKVLPSPLGRSNSKGSPAPVVNPIIPLSSPLWSNSTPSRDNLPSNISHKVPTLDYPPTVAPLHAYQTPPIKNFVGQTSWPQTCFPGPWLTSPQTSAFNSSICFQPVTMVEPVKLTPAKGASGQLTSGIKHVTTSSASHTVEASPVHEAVSALPDSKPDVTSEKHSVDSKPRKRKKVSVSNPVEVSLPSEARSEPVMVSSVATNLSLPVAAPAPAPASPVPSILNRATGDALTVCPVDHLRQGNMGTAAAVTCSEETMSNVAEAKNQAESAATLAAAAVSHSENLWSQLAKQKESGLTTEVEVKLASASVAIAAAASVAKAAAAAAKVAYSAALQAKQMADEAFLSSKANGSGRSSVDMHDIGNATPVSILKGDNITNQSNSILVAAKEAAKRRVEAASAASKQAENLDAIVKAAELAAAAVSHAGKIVAMGEPLPLSDLMEAGPEGYWKSPLPSEMAEKVTEKSKELASTSNLGEGAVLPAKVSQEHLVERGESETGGHGKTSPSKKSNDPLNGHASLVDGTMEPMHSGDRELKSSRDCTGSETARSSGVVSQLDSTPRTGTAQVGPGELLDSVPEDSINEGSVVEVFKHGGGLKSAWYSANVLRLEDGKAYVCYTDLLSEEGSANLCEWVPLEGEGDNAPVIRVAHPWTTLPFQATRKRRRAALGDYAWSVGDRVDVWIDDCWWEGVVTEKNEKDETTLKVHFPGQGETSTVRAWNLRTTRSWKDGKWVEWSSSRGNNTSEQGDTPQEKRQKLGSAAAPTDQKDTLANDVDSGSLKADEPKSLALSTSDRTFTIGKSTREDKKHAAQRPLRSGQQKEGSKVIFGVPKPGKKRKFMEVSKHFPTNRIDKNNETNDSVKFAKYLMPQATASRGWKAPSRNDSRERRTAESRSRAPSSRKPNRTLTQRDNLSATLGQGNDKSTDNRNNVESVIHDENQSEKLVAPCSSACEEAPEAPLSSLLANTLNAPSRKPPSSNTRSERVNKGKLAPSGGKLSKIVEEKVHSGNAGNSVTEVTEPRRSNRRIQPTHRLLEGLQSAMIIPKMTSVSHDRGPRNQSRNASAKGK